jgi:hypothetical protein
MAAHLAGSVHQLSEKANARNPFTEARNESEEHCRVRNAVYKGAIRRIFCGDDLSHCPLAKTNAQKHLPEP